MPERRHILLPLLVAGLLGACVTASPTPPDATSGDGRPAGSSGEGSTPSASSGFPPAGRPYTADDILAALRASQRPGGVPDEVETAAVAAAIADAIWTFDAQPWSAVSAGGSCGPTTCTVELVGTREGSDGEDLWSFDVNPAGGSVALAQRELGAVPNEVRDDLDALARSLAQGGELDDLVLASVTWLAPPDETAFSLAYRSGNEEGSCAVDIVLDPVARRVLETQATDC